MNFETTLSTTRSVIVQNLLEIKNAKFYHFYHVFFGGCDRASSFYNLRKTELWDSLIENDHERELSEVFQVLSNKSKKVLDYHMDIIEVFNKNI